MPVAPTARRPGGVFRPLRELSSNERERWDHVGWMVSDEESVALVT